MKYILCSLILLLAVLGEASFLTMPLVVGLCMFLTILFQEKFLFGMVVIFGIILDVLTFHPVGASSLFLVTFTGLVYIYKRKFEVQSIGFVGVSIFLSTLGYGLLFGRQHAIEDALICSFLFVGLYMMIEMRTNHTVKMRSNVL